MMNKHGAAGDGNDMNAIDRLDGFRERFHFPGAKDGVEPIYFTGNSLGLMPKRAAEYVQQELEDWARLAVDAHVSARHPWLPYHEFLTDQMARVVGAQPIETVVMNSLTVNLHLLLVSFFKPRGKRRKIVIEKGAFPSDQYAVESQIKCHGLDPRECLIELTPREGEYTLRTEDIIGAIESNANEIALVMLGGVNYYTGQAFEMKEICAAGHRAGAIVGFDLAHAAGNLKLEMHNWDVDFAVWCCYKYLNGGPGAVGGAFVHERHARSFDLCRFAGWWGHDKATRFLMGPEFSPLAGAEGWQVSNPPILQMAALRASLEIFDEVGMDNLRERSVRQTSYLKAVIDEIASDKIEVITPSDPEQRGCQLSVRVIDGDKGLYQKLLDHGVYTDWREPGVFRLAPVPLYNTFSDIERFGQILRDSLSN